MKEKNTCNHSGTGEKDRKFLEEKGKEFQFCYRTKEITVSDVVVDAEIILENIPVELVPKAKS